MGTQTDRPTKPITSSDTIALITNTVIPAIQNIQRDLRVVDEIKGEIAVINTRLENIADDTKNVNDTIKQFRVTLYGNGDPDKGGLVTIVAGLRKWVDDKSTYEKIIAAAVVGELIGLIFLLFIH